MGHDLPVLQDTGPETISREELLRGDRPGRSDDRRPQGDERRSRIMGAGGHTAMLMAKDRVIPVVPIIGRAGLAPFAAAVEPVVRGPEVPASVHLADISSQCGHMADRGGRHPPTGLGQGLGMGPHHLAVRHIRQLCQRADDDLAILLLDLVQVFDGLQIDDHRRVGGQDLILQGPQKIGAPRDHHDVPFCRVFRRLLYGRCLHMYKLSHFPILLLFKWSPSPQGSYLAYTAP